MAQRRTFKSKLGDLTDLYLQYHLQRKMAQEQSRLVEDRQREQSIYMGQRQKEAAEQQARLSGFNELIKNPQALARWQRENPGRSINGFDPSAFLPSAADAAQTVMGRIGRANALQELPSEAAYHAQLHAEPGYPAHTDEEDRSPVTQGMEMVAQQMDALKGAVQPTPQSYIDLQGNERERMVGPWDRQDVQTKRTGAQEGAYQAAQALGTITPEGTTAEIAKANQLEQGTRTGVIARAEAESAAVARGQQPFLLERERARRRANVEDAKTLNDYQQTTNLTAATRTMMEGAKMVLPHIAVLRTQAEALHRAGLFGPVMSRIRDLGARVGTVGDYELRIANDPELNRDRRVGQFATELGLMASGAARVHGGARGGGSPMMIAYMKSLLASTSSLPLFLGRMDSLDEYMAGYAAGPYAATDQSPIGAAALRKLNAK